MSNGICFLLIAICEIKKNVTDQMNQERKNKGHRPKRRWTRKIVAYPKQDDGERGHKSAHLQPKRKTTYLYVAQGLN
jgi:hypothetical protein